MLCTSAQLHCIAWYAQHATFLRIQHHDACACELHILAMQLLPVILCTRAGDDSILALHF